MDTYGDNLGEKYAAAVLEKYYETTVQDKITNADYEKLFSEGGTSVVKVKTFGDLDISDYTGSNLSVQDPDESEAELDPSEQKAYYFRIKSLSKFEDYINDPESALLDRAVKQLKQGVDTFVLGLYADVGSGNRVGVDYSTGTIGITITTGAVAGAGTTFTSGMVGLGFKATGHTKWYRIKTFTNTTTIVIENDSDDDDSSYDGGTISGSTAYVIEAATVRTVTISNILDYVDELSEKLDAAEVPKTDRWLAVNAKIAHLIRRSEGFTPAVESAYQDVVQKGLIGMVAGFNVFQNEQVSGNNVTGYYIMAGHVSAITFFMEFKETGIEDLIGNFGKAYKGLIVYGAKVIDERRKALAYLWCKV